MRRLSLSTLLIGLNASLLDRRGGGPDAEGVTLAIKSVIEWQAGE